MEQNFLKEINEDLVFFVEGKKMGWRNLDGQLCKSFENALDFCRGVFPDCEWNATFTLENKRLFIRLSHHDSPMGEQYEVMKAALCEACGDPQPVEEMEKCKDGWTTCKTCRGQ